MSQYPGVDMTDEQLQTACDWTYEELRAVTTDTRTRLKAMRTAIRKGDPIAVVYAEETINHLCVLLDLLDAKKNGLLSVASTIPASGFAKKER